MTPDLQGLATLDRVIHEPARLMIMTTLFAAGVSGLLRTAKEG